MGIMRIFARTTTSYDIRRFGFGIYVIMATVTKNFRYPLRYEQKMNSSQKVYGTWHCEQIMNRWVTESLQYLTP